MKLVWKPHSHKTIFPGLLILASLFLVIHIPAQEPEVTKDNQDVIRINTDLVQVRAVVTDRSGKLVDNLKQDDFEVLENEKPQRVGFFSLENISRRQASSVSAAPKSAGTPPTATAADAKFSRSIVLFVDTLHLTPLSFIRAKEQLRKFVDEQVTDEDMVAVITTSNSLGVLGQFMRDRKVLKHAIDKIALFQGSRSLYSPYLAAKVLNDEPGAIAVATAIMISEEGPLPPRPSYVAARAQQILGDEEIKRRAALLTLRAVAEKMLKMPGQRMIAFMSDGFTLLGRGDLDNGDFNKATSRAVQSGVVIYCFSPQGLTVSIENTAASPIVTPQFAAYMAETHMDQQNTLRSLAADTGGEANLNTNDVVGQLKKMLEANGIYYAIAYYPEDRSGKKFRNIKVRVKDHPDYKVRTQRGYQPAEEKKVEVASTPRQKLFQAMIAPLPATAIPLVSAASFLERSGDDDQVTVQLHISGDLGYEKKQDKFGLDCEIVGTVLDRAGKIANTFLETVRASFSAEQLEKARHRGYHYTRRLRLPPGLYQIRIGVRDVNHESIGTSMSWVEVPDLCKKKLALSSLFLGRQEEPTTANIAGSKTTSRPQLVVGPGSFRSGEPIFYRFVVYNATAEAQATSGLLLRVEVFKSGASVYDGDWHPLAPRIIRKDAREIEVGGQLQMRLESDFYTLRISVRDPKSKQKAEQTIDLELEP